MEPALGWRLAGFSLRHLSKKAGSGQWLHNVFLMAACGGAASRLTAPGNPHQAGFLSVADCESVRDLIGPRTGGPLVESPQSGFRSILYISGGTKSRLPRDVYAPGR
jgi:hypothetical protein